MDRTEPRTPEPDAADRRPPRPWADREPVLPEQTRDDTDRYWGEASAGNDERLLADRPPHWG